MQEKQRYRAKIETQMTSFNETLEEITTKAKLRKASRPDIQIEGLVKKHENAQAKLQELDKADENKWQQLQPEIDQLLGEIDDGLRKALAYFG
jgi:spermidine/putrescine-binding protein